MAIEARAAPTIPLMLNAIAAARDGNQTSVTACLQTFAETLDDLKSLLQRMYENCDPHVFYHRIRPFLAGSKNMAEAGLPRGVCFDDGTDSPRFVQYSGGSNAQSSAVQFFDIVLGIEHRPTGTKSSDSSDSEGGASNPPTHNFITEMRQYMPGLHKRFLEHVSSVANIREFVEDHSGNKGLCAAFDACLAVLRDFRDTHLQMVSRFIVVKSCESRSQSRSLSPRQAPKFGLAAKGRQENSAAPRKLRGTGGTALIQFLKQARDESGEPAVGAWTRRLMNRLPLLGSAPLGGVDEHVNGKMEIVGLAGIWSVDDSEGGICQW